MADMDTYDGEQRGYEGNNHLRHGTDAVTEPRQRYGYHGHSEIEHPRSQYHYGRYYSPYARLKRADTAAATDDRDYGRDRSRSPGPDRDGDSRIRDEPMNGRADR